MSVLKSIKYAFFAHLGISVITMYIGGLEQYLVKQLFIALAIVVLYFVIGFSLPNQGKSLKNLLAVFPVSLMSFVVAAYCCLVYQLQIVGKYHYAYETVHYKIIRTICLFYNASTVPASNLIGRVFPSFMLPYGWLVTFFIPAAAMWAGLEWRRKKDPGSVAVQ